MLAIGVTVQAMEVDASVPLPKNRPSPIFLNPPVNLDTQKDHALFAAIFAAIDANKNDQIAKLRPLVRDQDLNKLIEWRMLMHPKSDKSFNEIKSDLPFFFAKKKID